MPLIQITADNPDELFDAPSFPVIKAGEHLFVVANQMEIVPTSGEIPKDMLKIEARCQDEDENKGMVVFDNILLIASATTDKEIIAKKIHDGKLAQFVAACGVKTPEEIKAGEQFDVDDLNGKYFKAITVVRDEKIYPEELDERGKPKKAPRASIKTYLIPASEGEPA